MAIEQWPVGEFDMREGQDVREWLADRGFRALSVGRTGVVFRDRAHTWHPLQAAFEGETICFDPDKRLMWVEAGVDDDQAVL